MAALPVRPPPFASGTVAVSPDGVPTYVLDLLVRER